MKITEREIRVLRILWSAGRPLMVSEIVQQDSTATIYSVHKTIKLLLEKKLIDIDDIVLHKTSLARKYKAIVSDEIVEEEMVKEVLALVGSQSHFRLFASLLPQKNNCNALEELKKLEYMLSECMKDIC